jgi:mannose-6-phosphate isomerase-like protein (cupin superfamily)
MKIRNWRDQVPYIGHETKIIWPLLTRAQNDDDEERESSCLLSGGSLTRHIVQGRITTDYHSHENKEQVYYFVSGRAKMLIDDVEYDVTAGDAVHLAPRERHQVINNTEDDVEYLNITFIVPE